MPREIFGNKLPPVEESKISDIFHNMITNETFVFDDGEWRLTSQWYVASPNARALMPYVEGWAEKPYMIDANSLKSVWEAGGIPDIMGQIYFEAEGFDGSVRTLWVEATKAFGYFEKLHILENQCYSISPDDSSEIPVPEGDYTVYVLQIGDDVLLVDANTSVVYYGFSLD